MQSAMVVTWTHPVAGREAKALEYGGEVAAFWERQAAEGKCSQPRMYFSERGAGLWMVEGDRDVLMQLHDMEEAQMLMIKGELLLEAFSVDFCYAGDAASDYMMRYGSALSSIA